MNRNIILGFAGGLVFAISLIIGLVVTDNATDQGGGEARLPGALGDPIELVSGIPISDPDAPVDFGQPIEPTQAAYVPIDTGSGGGAGSSGGGGIPAGGGGGPSDGDTGADDATEFTVAPLAPEDGVIDADFRFGDFFIGDLYFEFLEYPLFRFLDLCADDGALPGCPPGVGGTVFYPKDDPPAGGFRLGSHIRTGVGDPRATGATCESSERDERVVFVWANQPAEFVITYYPRAFTRESAIRGGVVRTVTVSNADPDHPEFRRYAEDWAEHSLATSAWPQECFILTPILERLGDDTLTRTYDRYTVEVEATSFADESASRTYTIIRSRLTTTFSVRDDHSIDISIPQGGTRASGRWSGMSLIHESVSTTCADLEADGFHFLEITPPDESGMIFYGLGDTIHILDLEEGTIYLLCIWWFLDAERSFDDPTVVDREMRWINTPNRLTPVVTARAVQNRSHPFLPAESYTVTLCETITIPSRDLRFNRSTPIPGSPVLCDWAGRRFPNPAVGFFTTPTGARGEFAIVLDPSSPRGFQTLRADLSTADERGPTLILNAHFFEGSDHGGDDWAVGPPLNFEPLPEDPEELPAEIRIDRSASGVEPDGQDAIRVTAEFDRLVILNASLLGEPCLTGPDPSFTSPGRSATGGGFRSTWSFRFDGLCLLSQYSVVLEVEDRAGNTASFADIAPGLPEHPGARYFSGMDWTDGYHVEYTVWSTGAPESVPVKPYVWHFEASVAGERFDMRLRSRCLRDNLPGMAAFENLAGSPDAVWGDTPTITVSFSASEPGPTGDGGGCTPSERFRYESWTASFTSPLPSVADLEIGAPFEMRVPVTTVSHGPAPIDVELVIVGTVTG